jgi:hypothetical protein
VTSLRHHDTCFAWLVCLFGFIEDSHLNAGRRKPSSVLADSLFSCQRTNDRPGGRLSSGRVVARGDGRARTGDPLLAKQVLFQLSYIPERIRAWAFVDSNHRPHGYQPCALTN